MGITHESIFLEDLHVGVINIVPVALENAIFGYLRKVPWLPCILSKLE